MSERKTIDLNILGQVCPACLLVAIKEMNNNRNELKSGEAELVIKTDHRYATRTIPDSAKAMGFNVDIKKEETYYEIKISKRQ
ncbi:MAG: sulfurtransferase TusA family protein [Nitrospirota bacterium]